jgi:5-methylcytosine-specific restriction endonuclease McrA
MKKTPAYELRPAITNPDLWYPERPPKGEWDKIRKVVLERDAYTCQFCGHIAKKYMIKNI